MTLKAKLIIAGIVLSALIAAGFSAYVYIDRSMANKYKAGFSAGYDKRVSEEKEAEDSARIERLAQEKKFESQLNTHLDRIRQLNEELAASKHRRKFVYVPKEDCPNSNPTVANISLLNSAKGYDYGESHNPIQSDQDLASSSSLGFDAILEDSEGISRLYESLRLEHNTLVRQVVAAGCGLHAREIELSETPYRNP